MRTTFSLWIAIGFVGLIAGCAPIPHKVATLNPMTIHFKSASPTSAKMKISKRSDDPVCTHAVRTFEIKSGESKEVEGLIEKRLWMPLVPFDPLSGFDICIEQDGNNYEGMHYTKMGYAENKVEVECAISEKTIPFKSWPVDTSQACKLLR